MTQIQISDRGRVQEQDGRQFFLAGKDRFVLKPDAKAPKVPLGASISIEGAVNDASNPMELRGLTVKTP